MGKKDAAKKCPRCGAEFWAPRRKLCMDCTLADRDRKRAQHGPEQVTPREDPPHEGEPTHGRVRHHDVLYGHRLATGFYLMNGVGDDA